jgi:hypothetical protein
MKKYISMIAASMMMASCLDTIILPDDKTVDEDFWQTKGDVAMMVNAAYQGMVTEDVLERLIVWGDFRSDEVVLGSEATGGVHDALEEMAAVNMQVTSTYADWSSIYSVINRCNIVLERAAEVLDRDPNYTEGDYNVDRAHMLALRSLCYFYLVRNYRDVPYSDVAYMNSSQNTQIAQSSPAYVLERCIADLEEAVKYAVNPRSYKVGEWRRVGWMTRDGINALLADIYLWRASVMHSAADYQKCVDYCNLVIESKRSQHVKGRNEVEEKEYPLADADKAYTALFVDQNAEESIFELQSKANVSVCNYFYKWSANGNAYRNSAEGFFKATNIFNNAASTITGVGNSTVFAEQDLRYYACRYKSSDEISDIRKMVSNKDIMAKELESRDGQMWTTANLDQNYIIYRLTDVMLMQAEALVELAGEETAGTPNLAEAFHLVQAVNTRSLYSSNLTDSMKWTSTYRNYTKSQMEILVMQERLRELCFEGKRWYDLLRYNYRHVTGVDYTRTFGEQMDADASFQPVANFKDMLTLATRGRGNDGTTVRAKMRDESNLYLPIPDRDIIVCPLLRQNPAYGSTNEYEKSY